METVRSPESTWSLQEAGFALLLLVVYGWVFPFFPGLNNPNELVRVYMARSIAEHGTYSIGTRSPGVDGGWVDHGRVYDGWGFVNDKALVCADPAERPPGCAGRLYAAKAPAASLFAVPVVKALDLAAGSFAHREPTRGEYVFVLRWLLGILPSIALLAAVENFHPDEHVRDGRLESRELDAFAGQPARAGINPPPLEKRIRQLVDGRLL